MLSLSLGDGSSRGREEESPENLWTYESAVASQSVFTTIDCSTRQQED